MGASVFDSPFVFGSAMGGAIGGAAAAKPMTASEIVERQRQAAQNSHQRLAAMEAQLQAMWLRDHPAIQAHLDQVAVIGSAALFVPGDQPTEVKIVKKVDPFIRRDPTLCDESA